MFRSRLFGFVAVTLCLFTFVCAHGAVSEQTVRNAVREAKGLTHKVLMNVQEKYRDAERIKEAVELYKARAKAAASDAEQAAKGNAKAAIFSEKAKAAATAYLKLYEEAKQNVEEAFNTANDLLTKARQLDNRAENTIVPDSGSDDEYKKLSESAAKLKNKTENLKNEITEAERLITTAESKLWTLSTPVEEAQVAKYQVDAVVKVVEIETMLTKADADIKVIEQKQKEVNATVEAIKELFTNISDEVFLSTNSFLTNAERDLNIITNSVNEVKEAQKEIVQQKTNADKALEEIKKQTKERKAENELNKMKSHTKNAANALAEITSALHSSGRYVQYANSRKEGLLQALAKKSSKPNDKDNKSTEIPQRPAEDGTTKEENKDTEQAAENNQKQPVKNDPIQTTKKGTEHTVEKNTDQSVNNELTQLSKQSTKQTVQSNQEPPENHQPTKPANNDTKQTVKNDPEESVNNAPIRPTDKETDGPDEKRPEKSVNTESTKPSKQRTKETVQNDTEQSVKDKIKRFVNNEVLSTSDVINDNAITETFSLLLALIVFAALHGGY